ncbi:unnamed protein product [Cylicostephanus goldi]|uniref:Uncharacterized protein n=1 Tax=Cylicostephanus goldi TaxID=71465 RepID=A0A3P6SYM2_CYLGO|nr:unnamed protein product [Cylicostephanus goldi]
MTGAEVKVEMNQRNRFSFGLSAECGSEGEKQQQITLTHALNAICERVLVSAADYRQPEAFWDREGTERGCEWWGKEMV